MSEQIDVIQVDAVTLDEAKKMLSEKIPTGYFLIAEAIESYGGKSTQTGKADTIEAAFKAAEERLPGNARIIDKKIVTEPERQIITIQAFDEALARTCASEKLPSSFALTKINVAIVGKKGFLGLGKTPHHYEVEIFKQACVEVIYDRNFILKAKIGKDARSGSDLEILINAQRDKKQVRLLCDNCKERCTALDEPVMPGEVPLMEEDTARRMAYLCEKCNIMLCGRCVGISAYSQGYCPRCGDQTGLASVGEARGTKTALA